ncbi:MAG: MFS transporter [Burkholderiales bacterium]|nr:MFS transporter [Anaerolineae bacterium]
MINRSVSNRLLYTLFISQSLFSAAQIAVVTLTTIVAVRLSADESVAGMPSTVVTFAQAFAAFPIAIITGRFGRRLGLTLSYVAGALGGIAGVLAILQGAFWLLLLSSAFMGMARAGAEQSRFAAGELFPEGERARMMGRLVFAGTIGAIGGPMLVGPSGRLMQSFGLDGDMGPWVILFALCGVAALFTLALLRPDPMQIGREMALAEANHIDRKNEPARTVRPVMALLMLPKVQLAILAALVSQTVMVVLMVMTPLHMDHHQHTRDAISMVIAAHTLGMFGLSAVTGYLIDRFGRISMLMVGAIVLIVSALLAPLSTDQFMLAFALFLLGLGWNFGYVAGSSLLADALQGEERARVQGVNDALVFFAAGFGSLASGPLFESHGFAGISMAGLLLTLGFIGMIFFLGRPQLRTRTA